MGGLKNLWTKKKAGSEFSTSDKRLQRYIDVDSKRRDKEKLQFKSTMKALKAAQKEFANDLLDANDKATKIINGLDDPKIEVVAEWQVEAERRLAAAEKTWPHKLETNLQKLRGKKPNGTSGSVRNA